MTITRAEWLVALAATVALSVGLLLLTPGMASAQPVACGQVITEDTTLENDLIGCPGDAVVIGADRITVDLNGHTVSSVCETDCGGTAVIDDSGGYDRVRILDGTIRPLGVAAGVALVDVDRSALEGLTVSRFPAPMGVPGVGVLLANSHRNKLDSSTIAGGDPALLLSASDRNEISRSSVDGGIAIHQGDGIRLADGSDHNELTDSDVTADGDGIGIFDSVGNRLTRNNFFATTDQIVLGDARRTVISRNTLEEGRGGTAIYMLSASDENVIERNEAGAQLWIQGDRNRVEHNDISESRFPAIDVSGGQANLVRKNKAMGGGRDGIAVESAATDTLVQGNLATRFLDDGIDVDAPGTVIRGNTATDNGDLGIEAVVGVIDGGGNRASGNGNPLQCLNVACR